jgi:hypothetical protein
MSTSNNPVLEDRVLSVKAGFYGFFGINLAQRATLERLLEVRRQRFSADHPAIASVYEGLAGTYFGYAADELHEAEACASEAERILVIHSKKGKNSFRIGKLVHLRCRIQQHLNNPNEALELGEEALEIYNNTKLLCQERASLMHTLVYLHQHVGSTERAERLAIEVKAVDHALMSMSSRRRF